jgi:hypothetical protein
MLNFVFRHRESVGDTEPLQSIRHTSLEILGWCYFSLTISKPRKPTQTVLHIHTLRSAKHSRCQRYKIYVFFCAQFENYFVTFFSIKPNENPLTILLFHAYTRTDRQSYFNKALKRWERTPPPPQKKMEYAK